MLHTKYQGSGPCGFRQEDFNMFSLAYVKYLKSGARPCLALEYNLNKRVRGPLGDASYLNTKALGIVASEKKIFALLPYRYKPMLNMITRGWPLF